MLRTRGTACFFFLLLLAICASGCIPEDSHVDEEKDPHFERGRNLASSQDFKGAVQEFEKALETNPRSAAAHFELGWLYDTKINDSAAAIYHYERYLQLQPNSQRAQTIDVTERIRGCKRELAGTEFPLPNNQNLQREVDKLTAENLALRQQLEALRAQQQAAASNAAQPSVMVASYSPGPAPAPPPAPVRARARVHIVKQRDTMSSIAAEYGLRTSALLTANPRVDPRRLRVGQTLNLP
ncbi:MAG TPA: LysM peptidoglycan-binding domain-containing protein [Candidatus Baltobacteraceae bacterium]|jgi:LysM repeat protein|nr:LysM peptidoglycan-binding domain-containing protein [Candidatus Baltobacteraceae bacterium]